MLRGSTTPATGAGATSAPVLGTAPGEPLTFTSVANEALQRERARVDELAMLAKRLVRELRKVAPNNVLASLSVDYLIANGLSGDVMRNLGDGA